MATSLRVSCDSVLAMSLGILPFWCSSKQGFESTLGQMPWGLLVSFRPVLRRERLLFRSERIVAHDPSPEDWCDACSVGKSSSVAAAGPRASQSTSRRQRMSLSDVLSLHSLMCSTVGKDAQKLRVAGAAWLPAGPRLPLLWSRNVSNGLIAVTTRGDSMCMACSAGACGYSGAPGPARSNCDAAGIKLPSLR